MRPPSPMPAPRDSLTPRPTLEPLEPRLLLDSTAVFNEIMYHPDGGDPSLEWIELHNQMAVNLDLSGWSIRGGVDYTFEEGTIFPGGGYLVIAADPAALQSATGYADALGPWTGTLDDTGEELELYENSNRLMNAVDFEPGGDWPLAPGGSGATLAKIDRDAGSAQAANWAHSLDVGGTPGAENVLAEQPALLLNEVAAAGAAEFFVELGNPTGGGVDTNGYIVAGSGGGQHTLSSGVLPAGGHLALTAADLGFSPASGDRLFLYGPGGDTVLDAACVTSRGRGRSAEHDGRWQYPDAPTPGAPNSFAFQEDVVINELMYHAQPQWDPFTESDEEWLELYNRGDVSIDLTGWRLADGIDYQFPAGTILPAGGYLVVARDTDALAGKYPDIDIVGDFSGRLSNSGERLLLLDPAGNLADELTYYDDHPWPEYADGRGSSLELRDPNADNDVPEAWAASDETDKADWQYYSYRGIATDNPGPDEQWNEFIMGLLHHGEVLIDDIHVVEDPDGAAVEFLQNGTFETGLDAWRVVGNHRHSSVIPDPDDPGNHVLHLVATGATEHHYNQVETTFADGREVTNGLEYEISFRAKWLAGSPQLNTRLYFNRVARTTILQTAHVNGTPGAQNSRFETNIGPTYEALSHAPVLPEPGEAVEVSVRASDPDGVGSMTLWYRRDGQDWSSTSMSPVGDGVYTGTVPGQSAGTVMQFYVEGTDTLGASSSYPAAGPDSRAMYVVNDGVTAATALHDFRILMAETDRAWLQTNYNTAGNDRLGGTVIYDGRIAYYDVGVRLRGAGRTGADHLGWNVRFHDGTLFRGVHQTVGTDGSGITRPDGGDGTDQHEILLKQILNRVGGVSGQYDDLVYVIPPLEQYADTAQLTLARFNDVYLESQFENGDDGTVFKQELIYYPTRTTDGNPESPKLPTNKVEYLYPTHLGDDPELYRWTYLIENNRKADDYSAIIDMCRMFDLSQPAKVEVAEQVLDVDQWLRAYAWTGLISSFDNFLGSNTPHNLKFYVRPEDGRILALPWDNDFLMKGMGVASTPTINGALLYWPKYDRLYYGHLYDMLQTAYHADYLTPWVDHYSSLIPDEDWQGHLDFHLNRRSFLLSALPSMAPFEITTNGGADFSIDENLVTISGTAWIDVREIHVTGRPDPLELDWSDKTHWEGTIPLAPGENVIELVGYDFQGQPVHTDTITVTNTAAMPLATDELRVTELMYNPPDPPSGPYDNDDYEFIEIRNIAPGPVDLRGMSFTDGIEFAFDRTGTRLAGFDFDDGPQGWVYADDVFGTNNPDDTDGWWADDAGYLEGGLEVYLGPGYVFGPISGGFSTEFTAVEDGTVAVTFRYRMFVSPHYEPNEYCQIMLAVDGQTYGIDGNDYIDRIVGDGDGGPTADTGWREATVEVPVSAGGSTLILGAYNNRSSDFDEWSRAYFDDVRIHEAVDTTLPAGGVVLLVKNGAAFRERYGTGLVILGEYGGQLSNSGERLELRDAFGQVAQAFTYDDDWLPQTDGEGYSLTVVDPHADPVLWSTPQGWRASNTWGGSPGEDETATLLPGDIVISELMAFPDGPEGDWVELHNTTQTPISIGGWYLSDKGDDLLRYQIPEGTVLPAGGYLVLTSAEHFGVEGGDGVNRAFGFSRHGEDVYLSASEQPGVLTGWQTGETFAASREGVTYGRYVRPDGEANFVPLQAPTPGEPNTAPRVGPVVIGEMMYHPLDGDEEYVELRNVSTMEIPLFDLAWPAHPWRFTDGITLTFPSGATIPAGGVALVVPIDPTAFRTQYGIAPEIPIYGPYTGKLDNAGERVELSMPGLPNSSGDFGYVPVDAVLYDDKAPWPEPPDGDGPALVRIDPWAYANDPGNWQASAVGGTPGVPDAPDTTPPTVAAVRFRDDVLTVWFSEDVAADLTTEALTLTRDATGQSVDLSAALFTYDVYRAAGTWDLSACALAAGEAYTAVLSAEDISDGADHPLDGDGDGIGGDNHLFGFLVPPADVEGDFTGDGVVDVADIDDLAAEIAGGAHPPAYDLTGDGLVDTADMDRMIRELVFVNADPTVRGTEYGDATLDGAVDAADLSLLAAHWQGSAESWAEADFTGDGTIDAADLSLLAGHWQYLRAAPAPLSTTATADPPDATTTAAHPGPSADTTRPNPHAEPPRRPAARAAVERSPATVAPRPAPGTSADTPRSNSHSDPRRRHLPAHIAQAGLSARPAQTGEGGGLTRRRFGAPLAGRRTAATVEVESILAVLEPLAPAGTTLRSGTLRSTSPPEPLT